MTAVDRGRFTVELVDEGDRELYAVKARELGRKGIVVGDRVSLVGDLAGGSDALARIVRRRARTSVLHRSADDTDTDERIIVANADQLAVVVALADPEPRTRLIDRALVAAFDGGLQPLLVLTKSDLASDESLRATYDSLGVPFVVTRRRRRPERSSPHSCATTRRRSSATPGSGSRRWSTRSSRTPHEAPGT